MTATRLLLVRVTLVAMATAPLMAPRLSAEQTTAPAIVPSDLEITAIGTIAEGRPAQMAFGPDGRLYISLATFGSTDAPSVVSYAYSAAGALTDGTVAARTGGAIGIAFGAVSLGVPGSATTVVTTGMYLTDTARRGISNLRVLTRGAEGLYGGGDGRNTVIVQNLPGGYHQADQIVVKNGVTLYVGLGVRTADGVTGYPAPSGPKENAYGGTISQIADLRQVNGLETDAAGFGLTGDTRDNTHADYSNAGPFVSTAQGKLVVHSAGTRNPFGLALDPHGDLWFTNNFATVRSDGTFDGRLDPATGLLRGFDTGDLDLPSPDAPDLNATVYDQLFRAVPRGDYGYNNVNWRTDSARHNPRVTSTEALKAGFFDFTAHGVRSTTFDNLMPGDGGFRAYDQSDVNRLVGLGPGSSATGLAFCIGSTFPARYRGRAFITRWNGVTRDSRGHRVDYRDVVAVDVSNGLAVQIAIGFANPIAVLEDGHGNLLIADHGAKTMYRISPRR